MPRAAATSIIFRFRSSLSRVPKFLDLVGIALLVSMVDALLNGWYAKANAKANAKPVAISL